MILKKGDEIRVIAPSKSIKSLSDPQMVLAKKKLESMGYKVTFSKNSTKKDDLFKTASIENRVKDLHDAFLDKNVKAIICARGGYLVNQILNYIDYDIVKNNPKPLIGFSDITALLNAIYKMTGIETFHGPTFSFFSMEKGFEYIEEYFNKLLTTSEKVTIESSKEFSNDDWFGEVNNRKFIKNEGMKVINEGKAKGTIIGGNLCTLNLLQGTKFMPSLKDKILFIEDDDFAGDKFFYEFDRNLESLIQQDDFKYVKGIVIGRCELGSEMNEKKWKKLIKNKKGLNNIPIIIDADFGHTTPAITFPIGGKCHLSAFNNKIELTIEK